MTSLTIEKIVEHENGSATLTIDMDNEMLQRLLQHSLIDLLKKEVGAEENNDKKRRITTKKGEYMNERIELVKKWLNDTNSVTSEELETNSKYAAADACRAEQIVHVALADPDPVYASAVATAVSTTVASSCAHAAAQYSAYVSRQPGFIKPSWIQHVQAYIDRYDEIINE